MSIRHAILGFLSWRPFTGYELKKKFSDALSFHWSGNNNQIYGTLVQLHREGAVSIEVVVQEKLPAKKLYTITDSGRRELREWLASEPELPEFKSDFATRLAWAGGLGDDELGAMVAAYESLLEAQIAMCRERLRRGIDSPSRSEREKRFWAALEEHAAAFYETELKWISEVMKAESGKGAKDEVGNG